MLYIVQEAVYLSLSFVKSFGSKMMFTPTTDFSPLRLPGPTLPYKTNYY